MLASALGSGGWPVNQGFGFDREVPRDGYAWWYLDAVSADGEHALTLIAFVGSVFSPYYAWARRWAGVAGADPNQHCAFNVGLYDLTPDRRHGNVWTMTERGAGAVQRSAQHFQVGPSALQWQDNTLVATINEVAVPWPQRVKGRIRLTPSVDVSATDHSVAIDADGQHFWRPIAPTARVEVEFDHPGMQWTGHAYLDSNYGATPLETSFKKWQWSRGTLADGSTAVRYDVTLKDDRKRQLARRYAGNGAMSEMPPELATPMARTRWGIERACHSTAPSAPTVSATLESGPFYARSLIDTQWFNQPVAAVHESLSLTRFANPIVQGMLPFRMPRRSR